MRVQVDRTQLSAGLIRANRAIVVRGSDALSSTLLLASDGSRLKVAAVSRELSIISWLPCELDGAGGLAIPARKFTDFVADLPGDIITLELDSERETLIIRAENENVAVDTMLQALPVEDFPTLPKRTELNDEVSVSINSHDLAKLVSTTRFAVANLNKGRPDLLGIQVTIADNRITLFATDGDRLAMRSAACIDNSNSMFEPISVIASEHAMREIMHVISEETEEVTLTLSKSQNRILCHTSTVEMWVQLIDGNFPDWRKVIPKQLGTKVIVNRRSLLELLRLAAYFTEDDSGRITLTLQEAGKLLVSSSGSSFGEHTSFLLGEVVGVGIEITLNGRYLRDALRVMDTDHVILETRSSTSPVVLRPVDDSSHVHLIMPFYLV